MLTELLVVLACTQNQGCGPTTNLYFQHNPEIKHLIKRQETKAKDFLGPKLVSISPFALLMIQGRGTFKLGSHLSLQTSRDETLAVFSYDF